MRILFMGTPEFAAEYLRYLLVNKFNVVAVISQKDKPRGRGLKLLPTPVKEVALQYHIPVFQPANLNKEGLEIINEYKPDIGIVVAYGRLIKSPFLDTIPLYNVHTSLLPKYRGPAPMQRAIENGDRVTGVTIFKINEGMDEGDIALQEEFEIGDCETFGDLYKRFIDIGTKLLGRFLNSYPVALRPQEHSKATYAPKIEKEDLYIDFSKTACDVRNKIRAYDPSPGARCILNNVEVKLFGACKIESTSEHILEDEEPGTIVRIDKSTEEGVLRAKDGYVHVKYIQFPGKNKITFYAAKNGGVVKEGMCFLSQVFGE